MRQTTDNHQPRTASPRFSTDGFDCELPPEARDELFTPKRPRILGRPVKASHGLHRLAVAVLAIFLIVAAVIALTWHQAPAVQPAASPQPTPSPEPIQSPAAIEHVIEQPILPPRAQLLKLPRAPQRATLVRLPSPRVDILAITPEHIDEAHDITMPYGTVVHAALRGFLEQENQLPRVGRIGDMYVVGSVPWIWIQAPGSTAPIWIDP